VILTYEDDRLFIRVTEADEADDDEGRRFDAAILFAGVIRRCEFSRPGTVLAMMIFDQLIEEEHTTVESIDSAWRTLMEAAGAYLNAWETHDNDLREMLKKQVEDDEE
jgi:hypothetical protein